VGSVEGVTDSGFCVTVHVTTAEPFAPFASVAVTVNVNMPASVGRPKNEPS